MRIAKPYLCHFRLISAVLALCCSSCAGEWSSRPLSALTPIATGQQVQVWHSGRAEVLHAVRLDSAHLTGIPYFKSVACDSCRVVIPRAQIDSVRVGDASDGAWKTVALLFGLGFATYIVYGVYCAKTECEGN